ncbi:MAG TPA: hypothetical protein DCM28_09180 [Phycisphaerales bacterium]|nr:hypothetical protein [Phycisphaerales bacterium]HCD31010.1 hypothetical protein [Phycisphaerales bacterium]|tara:strand:+ start:169218 stop:171005 length:1788 start_codon:yes stop_codon:yes gene_type:complete
MQMLEMLKQIGAGTVVGLCVMAGCTSSSTKKQDPTPLNAQDAEMEYMAFRSSHSGEGVKPNQLKSPKAVAETMPAPAPTAMAEPEPVAVAVEPTPIAKPTPAPAPEAKPQPVQVTVATSEPAPEPVVKPTPAPVVAVAEPQPAPKPMPVVQQEPVVDSPAPTVAVATPDPQPVTKPVAQPAPAPIAKPVATPLPQPAPVAKSTDTAVASPVSPAAAQKQSTVSPEVSQQIVSNSSLSASDGFLSSRHQVTASERTFTPAKRVKAKLPAEKTLPLPTMEQLVQNGTVYDARIVLNQINDANLAMIAQAIRIIIKEAPREGKSDLYDVVRYAKAAAPRAMAIDALLQAYPQNATYSAQKLLQQTRYNRIDRLVVGNRIMQYRINRTYPAAITNLGYDASGKAMFDARRGILAADKAVALNLKNYAARYSTRPASFIARRLYHWIRNDDRIEQAYEDTFVKHPSELGVIMFRERFGEEALTLLQQAQTSAAKKLQPVITRELAKLSDDASPALMFGFHKLYVIKYTTPQGNFSLLCDQSIWPDQAIDEMYQQSDSTSSFTQQVINVKADELADIKKLPNTWKSGVKVHGIELDTIDLK